MDTFANGIYKWRIKCGMDQRAAAAAFGMPLGTYRHYEQGMREPAEWVKPLMYDHMKKFASARKKQLDR